MIGVLGYHISYKLTLKLNDGHITPWGSATMSSPVNTDKRGKLEVTLMTRYTRRVNDVATSLVIHRTFSAVTIVSTDTMYIVPCSTVMMQIFSNHGDIISIPWYQ